MNYLQMDTPILGLAGASFGVTSFVSSSHPTESCGINGLPLTPHSISILGTDEQFKDNQATVSTL